MLFDERLMAFVPATDLARAREFYTEVLGLEVADSDDFGLLLRTGTGGLIRVAKVDELQAPPYTVLGWIVTGIHDTIESLTDVGVEFVRYDGMNQDDKGVWTAPDGAEIAWFRDPDGNVLSLTDSLVMPID